MNYIVFDLEWNQGQPGQDAARERLPFEIFEIGAVKLNEKREKISAFHRLIRPVIYREMNRIISEVTHVSMEEIVRNGRPFGEVIRDFLAWCGEDAMFCTWGNMDLTELQRNMSFHGVEIPFKMPLLFYDVQKLYSLLYSDGKSRESLEMAVAEQSVRLKAPFHRALGDAEYTAGLLARMDFEPVQAYCSVDYFRAPKKREEEFTLNFPGYAEIPGYSKFVSRTFPDRETAMTDKSVTDMICCACRRMLRKKIRWFAYGQRYYLCLAVCPEHGLLKGKIRMKKADGGMVFAVKTVKFVDEAGAEMIEKKKEEARIKRAERQKLKARGER